jgi:ubiquinone/menaquinone biosynthesis C-methylase UbiE
MGATVSQPVRLHVGSGRHYWPGWVNVDQYSEADVQWEAPNPLPYQDRTVDEIQSHHFLEHVPRVQVDGVLADFRRVLRAGGKIVLELPCLEKICQNVLNGERNMRLTLLGLFGDPRDPKPGMMHQWCWGKRELTEALDQAGFIQIEFMEPQFHIPARDMRVEAYRP